MCVDKTRPRLSKVFELWRESGGEGKKSTKGLVSLHMSMSNGHRQQRGGGMCCGAGAGRERSMGEKEASKTFNNKEFLKMPLCCECLHFFSIGISKTPIMKHLVYRTRSSNQSYRNKFHCVTLNV